MANIEERVEALIKPKIEKIGYELYDVEYAKEGKNYFLRIFIDSPNGIDLKDCEKVNDEINEVLDSANYIKDQYFLEVSSPGIERVLRKDTHLEQNIGKEVNINLFKKDENGKKELSGILEKIDDEYIIIKDNVNIKVNKKTKDKESLMNEQGITDEETNIKIERKNISQIKIKYNW